MTFLLAMSPPRALVLSASLVGCVLAAACASSTAPTPAATTTSNGVPASDPVTVPATARYRATFQATWSAASHPVEFPATAHFSPLVGAVHNRQVVFWREAGIATDGIKDMAERGLTSTLSAEIDAAVSAGTAQRAFIGGSVAASPGVATAEFEASQSFPLVTLVSMIAPSPDWFVGVSGLALFENGEWAAERRVSLDPWDAGSDGGATFLSPDLALAPRLPISRIVTSPLSPAGRVSPLGTFSFTRIP